MIATHAYGEPGTYTVTLTVTDNDGNFRSTTKQVAIMRSYLTVNLDVGTIHFRGEIAEFYIQTSVWGTPVNVDAITATLYYGTQQQDLTSLVTQVDIGLYRISYSISPTASEGTWLLVTKATYLALSGTTMKSFLISSTLTSWGAELTGISNGVATIQTDVGVIRINLADLNATVIGVQNGIATISTNVGIIQTSLSSINAALIGVQSGVAIISTDVGTIRTSLSAINATVIDVQDGIATLSTDLGEIQVSVDQLSTDTTEVKNRLPVDTGTIVTVLYVATILAAIAAILSLYELFKMLKR
jgi:PKD repeat protein